MTRGMRTGVIAACGLLLALAACSAPAPSSPVAAAPTPAARFRAQEALYPPWQAGENNDAGQRGLVFTVPPVDVLADFHGRIDHPRLVLYVAGNYYFALAPLVRAFGEAYPQYRGGVYYETLPPGLLQRQMAEGGTITAGNMTWTARPDVFMAGLRANQALKQQGKLIGDIVAFATNDLTIMVPAGNPDHITGLADLARPDLVLAMPNPQFEGVARQIQDSLKAVGGAPLVDTVYTTKVRDGTTILTHIHHRQTPLLLMQGVVRAGVTWTSEAMFQEQIGHPISHVAIPASVNTRAIYSAAAVAGTVHPAAVQAWLRFIGSPVALKILRQYGLKAYEGGGS